MPAGGAGSKRTAVERFACVGAAADMPAGPLWSSGRPELVVVDIVGEHQLKDAVSSVPAAAREDSL